MLRVVGVEASLDELAAAEGVVVRVDAGRRVAQHADRVAGDDGGPEPVFVLAAVAALPGAAAPLIRCGPAGVASAAPVGELSAAGP